MLLLLLPTDTGASADTRACLTAVDVGRASPSGPGTWAVLILLTGRILAGDDVMSVRSRELSKNNIDNKPSQRPALMSM